jgi:ribosomal protein S18 acetylase RimI-like enzyme
MRGVTNSSSFTVRAAVATDIPVLARQRVTMFRDMARLAPVLAEPLELGTASFMRDALPRGEYLAWVAESTGRAPAIVGGAGVQLRPILPRPREDAVDLELGPEAMVLNVYVEPAWRRQGIAEALMRALLDDLHDRNIRRIVLHAADAGRRIYERLGFTATNEMRLTRRA